MSVAGDVEAAKFLGTQIFVVCLFLIGAYYGWKSIKKRRKKMKKEGDLNGHGIV